MPVPMEDATHPPPHRLVCVALTHRDVLQVRIGAQGGRVAGVLVRVRCLWGSMPHER